MFFYGIKNLAQHIDFFLKPIKVIQELTTKKRKIRSLRGFLLLTLEIIDDDGEIEVLETNLESRFWFKVKYLIRQNRSKEVLLNFLFPTPISEISNQNLFQKLNLLEKRLDRIERKLFPVHRKEEDGIE